MTSVDLAATMNAHTKNKQTQKQKMKIKALLYCEHPHQQKGLIHISHKMTKNVKFGLSTHWALCLLPTNIILTT
jgi:hypothetical protein